MSFGNNSSSSKIRSRTTSDKTDYKISKISNCKCLGEVIFLSRDLSYWKRAQHELPLFPIVSPPNHPVYSPRGHVITYT